MNRLLLIMGAFLLLSNNLQAQKTWTLRECIDYARQENIQVKKMQLSVESAKADVSQSKAALFPSLNGSLSQSYNHSKDAVNDYHYQNLFGGQYGLNASWTIYNGGVNINTIKQNELLKETEELNTQRQQNDIELSITETFLQLLYARESIKNNENIVESSAAQLRQTQDFLDAGTITRAEFAQVEAQYSSDRYNLVLAQNAFDSYKLQLKQLLELDMNAEFEIAFPEIDNTEVLNPIPTREEVYLTALDIMPEIKSNQLGMEVAEIGKSIAKGGYMPTISLNGSLGTSNSWNSDYPSFSNQIDRNFNQYAGVSVSIPIFDNKRNKTNVKKSELQIETAKLNYTDAQKTLLKTIESLHQDAVSSQSKYSAAVDKVRSSELSYTLVKEQFALGMRNTVELTTEQNNYANALQDLLQAKYATLLSLKLLQFYQGEEITL